MLNIVGRVLPATLGVVRLCAELDDGTIVEGESNISHAQRPIERIFFEPERRRAARRSDRGDSRCRRDRARPRIALHLDPAELLGIDGSPTKSPTRTRVKMYVCNVMTQPGETDDMTAADHVEALFLNAGARVCDYVDRQRRAAVAPARRLRRGRPGSGASRTSSASNGSAPSRCARA